MLFRQYLLNNGHDIKLSAIADSSRDYNDFKEPLAAALEHERYVTESINTIYTEAIKLKDYRTVQFLDWFVKEQGEEEKNAEDNLRRFELFGAGKGLYMLDRDLKAREHAAPSLVLD
ncbi:MAG: ferritin, partial [Sphaerochaetaceae bacterium]|nr:ferritin [Sphaerochaetaceae bacterium]